MNPVYDKLLKCYESFRQKIDFKPEVAIVLGSGLGDYADDIRVEAELDYHEIEGFPVSTVPGHAGKFIFGYVGQVPVVCMKGRVHYYEGYPISDVVLPARLMKMMGAKILFLTNAAGGVGVAQHGGHHGVILGVGVVGVVVAVVGHEHIQEGHGVVVVGDPAVAADAVVTGGTGLQEHVPVLVVQGHVNTQHVAPHLLQGLGHGLVLVPDCSADRRAYQGFLKRLRIRQPILH